MKKSIRALIVAFAAFALVLATGSAGFAGDQNGYPDWATETFTDAEDKGSP